MQAECSACETRGRAHHRRPAVGHCPALFCQQRGEYPSGEAVGNAYIDLLVDLILAGLAVGLAVRIARKIWRASRCAASCACSPAAHLDGARLAMVGAHQSRRRRVREAIVLGEENAVRRQKPQNTVERIGIGADCLSELACRAGASPSASATPMSATTCRQRDRTWPPAMSSRMLTGDKLLTTFAAGVIGGSSCSCLNERST